MNVETEKYDTYRCRLRLEVPIDPALCLLLEDIKLSVDVVGRIGLQLLRPLVDEISIGARSNICAGVICAIRLALGVCPVISCANAVSVLWIVSRSVTWMLPMEAHQCISAVCHST
jgi:hypothetical protein